MVARRIGVFGGTFDPVHMGHLVAAVNARHVAGLDLVLLVVANDPWQKSPGRSVSPPQLRLAAVSAAVAGHPHLQASSLEIDRGGPSYTIDTVRQLLEFPGVEQVSVIVGADAAANLDSWHEAPELARLVQIIVVNRPTVPLPILGDKWRHTSVEIPSLDISSTDLRLRLEDGRPLDFLIPDEALEVLKEESRRG